MADRSNIEWTEATVQVVRGCAPVSPGCKRCYAARLAATRLRHNPLYAGLAQRTDDGDCRWNGTVRTYESELSKPYHWRKPKPVFVASMGDLFHEQVPFAFIDRVLKMCSDCSSHTFQILTKRAERMTEYFNPARLYKEVSGENHFEWPLPNVWLGVSAENQRYLDTRWPQLYRINAFVRFISFEPLFDSVQLGPAYPDWVIVGGETGPKSQAIDTDHARSIRDQCSKNHIPFFYKRKGGTGPDKRDRLLDGKLWEEYPVSQRL